MVKQNITSRNNKFMADIKKVYNNKIYKKARKIYIEQGEEKTLEYINKFGDFYVILEIINN